jgi:hypothetical protein
VNDDGNDGPQVSEQQRPSDRGIDGVALAVQVLVAQQTIHLPPDNPT